MGVTGAGQGGARVVQAAIHIDEGTEHELTPLRKKAKAGDSKRPYDSVKTEEDDIKVSTEKESVEHVEEVKNVEPVMQEELTPNDDTGVSQEDDKDVVTEPKVDEKDDMKAEEEKAEVNEIENKEKDKDMDEDELSDEKREEHGDLGFEEEHEEITADAYR
nr:nucleotide-binding, alpha-beta plait [Tanacetum cinerariifolium]